MNLKHTALREKRTDLEHTLCPELRVRLYGNDRRGGCVGAFAQPQTSGLGRRRLESGRGSQPLCPDPGRSLPRSRSPFHGLPAASPPRPAPPLPASPPRAGNPTRHEGAREGKESQEAATRRRNPARSVRRVPRLLFLASRESGGREGSIVPGGDRAVLFPEPLP